VATKTKNISIRIGPKLHAELMQAAAENEMTLGEFIRYVVVEYLKHTPSK
jgi:predicted HicB family RNase H-like nuclease